MVSAGSRSKQIFGDLFEGRAATAAAPLPELLCRACTQALRADGAGLWVMNRSGTQSLVAVTDGTARILEDLQFTMGEGPCIDAFVSGRPVAQPDLSATAPTRWPGFGPAAVQAGVGAVFAFPLQLGNIRLGVLDVYRNRPGALSDAETLEALSYSDAATMLLLYLQQQAPSGEVHPQLDTAWTGRPEVHQATGMLSVQAGLGLAQALQILRAHAYQLDRPIRDIAAEVVSRKLRFDPTEQEFVAGAAERPVLPTA